MTRKNGGYSLIELIVIIAILGIIAVGSIIGLGMINGKPADQCANALKMTLTSHRLSTMGKNEESTYMEIYMESDGSVWIKEVLDGVPTVSKACDKGVSVSYHVRGTDDANMVPLSPGGTALKIGFNRSNGSFRSGFGDNIEYLRISKATHSFKLTFFNLTGKVLLERE